MQQAIKAFEREELSESKTYIDQVLEEPNARARGDAWYYRGVICEKLLRGKIATEEAPQLLEETLAAYGKVLTLTPVASQYHSFAQINLNVLWAYYLERGRRYCKREALESALQQFKCCEEILPGNPLTYLYTAIAAHQADDYDLALRHYTDYLASGVVVPAAVYHGLAYLTAYSLKDPEKALVILGQALLQYPFDNDLLYIQLQLHTTLGQVDTKRKLLQEWVAATPYEASSRYQLGYWYEQQGQWQQALAYYKNAAELAPNDAEPVRQQGIVYYNQGVQCTQETEKMSEEEFKQSGAHWIQELGKHFDNALPYFEQAAKLSPRDPLVLKPLQHIYQFLQRPAQARRVGRCIHKYKL